MLPVRLAVLTVSDSVSRGTRDDVSGDTIEAWARERGFTVVARDVVADDQERIALWLAALADGGSADVVITTGGTGLTSADLTPEATREVIEREAPGIAEAIRGHGAGSTPMAWLSRGIAGVRARALIVNLPGSTGGVRDGLEVLAPLLQHAAQLLRDEDTGVHPPAPPAHG